MTREAWIIDAVRTPRGIGKQGKGALSHLHPQRLGATVLGALQQRNELRTGRGRRASSGAAARRSGSRGRASGGCRRSTPAGASERAASRLDRFCGSGITAVNLAAASILSGMEDLVVAGGVEMMSFTATLPPGMLDAGNLHLRDLHPQPHQGVCADVIATLEGATRDDVDRLALASQQRAARAIAGRHFAKEPGPGAERRRHGRPRSRRVSPAADDARRLGQAASRLLELHGDAGRRHRRDLRRPGAPDAPRPSRSTTSIMPGTPSGVVDGSATLLLASPDYAKRQGWKPRARVVAMANAAGSPSSC